MSAHRVSNGVFLFVRFTNAEKVFCGESDACVVEIWIKGGILKYYTISMLPKFPNSKKKQSAPRNSINLYLVTAEAIPF